MYVVLLGFSVIVNLLESVECRVGLLHIDRGLPFGVRVHIIDSRFEVIADERVVCNGGLSVTQGGNGLQRHVGQADQDAEDQYGKDQRDYIKIAPSGDNVVRALLADVHVLVAGAGPATEPFLMLTI